MRKRKRGQDDEQQSGSSRKTRKARGDGGKGGRRQGKGGKGGGKGGSGLSYTRNGRQLCYGYENGTCNSEPCPNICALSKKPRLHVCSKCGNAHAPPRGAACMQR